MAATPVGLAEAEAGGVHNTCTCTTSAALTMLIVVGKDLLRFCESVAVNRTSSELPAAAVAGLITRSPRPLPRSVKVPPATDEADRCMPPVPLAAITLIVFD